MKFCLIWCFIVLLFLCCDSLAILVSLYGIVVVNRLFCLFCWLCLVVFVGCLFCLLYACFIVVCLLVLRFVCFDCFALLFRLFVLCVCALR